MIRQRNAGFSLVELLFALVIIGVLTAIIIPQFVQALNNARDAASRGYTHNLALAVESKRAESGTLPMSQTCASVADEPTHPPSVATCTYQPNATTDTYTLTVISKTGKMFFYDGYTISELN